MENRLTAVLAILLIFSVWSWGVILSKALLLRKVTRESQDFWRIFRKGQSLSEISTASETLRFTRPGNLFGLCGVSLPIGHLAGARPVGLQLLARGGDDAALLGIAAAIETLLVRA
jgi:Asp-tRNA(Asn)/Glu-tRNA(Gln) amidotransferase A subunit family amidase